VRDPIGVSSSVWDSRKVEGVVPLLPHGAKDRAYTNIMCCGVFIPKKCTKFGYPARSPRFSPTWCERVSKSIKKIIAGSQSSATKGCYWAIFLSKSNNSETVVLYVGYYISFI